MKVAIFLFFGLFVAGLIAISSVPQAILALVAYTLGGIVIDLIK